MWNNMKILKFVSPVIILFVALLVSKFDTKPVLLQPAPEILIPVEVIYDEIKSKPEPEPELETRVLGSYETKYLTLGAERNRANNIKTAADRVNIELQPTQIFSYNDAVGPRTEENGFVLAPTIFDGEIKPGIGGGVCQVSSTIYAAALMANLAVVHRRPHTRVSKYIPAGLDSTVSYPIKCDSDAKCDAVDLVVSNSWSSPIKLQTYVIENKGIAKLRVEFTTLIYKGTGPIFTTEYKWYSRPFEDYTTEIRKLDSTIDEKEIQKGQNGIYVFSTLIYKYEDKSKITRKWKSRYPAVTRILEVGPDWEDKTDAGDSNP
jgi:vancomycin resistance protein YoaR